MFLIHLRMPVVLGTRFNPQFYDLNYNEWV